MYDAETIVLLPAVDWFDTDDKERVLFDKDMIDPRYTIDGAYPTYLAQDLITEGVYGLVSEDFKTPGTYVYSVLLDSGDFTASVDGFESVQDAFDGLLSAWDKEYGNA